MSCGVTWSAQTSRPSPPRARAATTSSAPAPGTTPPFGNSRRPAPRAGIRVPRIDAAVAVDRQRLPGAAASAKSGKRQGSMTVTNFQRIAARLAVERVERALAARRVADRAREHEVARDDRRDSTNCSKRLMSRRSQRRGPSPRRSRTRACRWRRRCVVGVRDPVRARVRRAEAAEPQLAARLELERRDVAPKRLHVHPPVDRERRRGVEPGVDHRAGSRYARRAAASPHSRVDRRAAGGAGRGEVAVRLRPVARRRCDRRTRSAPGQPRGRGRA